MKISTQLEYSGDVIAAVRRTAELESAGLDMAWVAEPYGFDAPSQVAYLAALTTRLEIGTAILPIYTRTPSLIAMTAATLDALSGGRFHLGLGASGPQVIEGFHGVRYDAPLGRTREVIDICRLVWAREAPLTYQGKYYRLPLPAEEGTGLGKALKLVPHPVRSQIPIWVASMGSKNVQLTAEYAQGWLPAFFLAERAQQTWGADLAAGLSRRAPELGPLQTAAGGLLAIGEGEDVRQLRQLVRPRLALYVGGMGAKGRNYYNTLMCSYGFEAEAATIQDLYLDGKKDEAAAAVPDEMLDSLAICGAPGYVAERLAAMAEAGVTHANIVAVPVNGQSVADVISLAKELAP